MDQKEKDFQLCECGHIRRAHYEGIGKCDENTKGGTYSFNPNACLTGPCRCSRFKKEYNAVNTPKG